VIWRLTLPGYSLTDYGLVLVIWGVVWMFFGSGLVYLLARYFASEDKSSAAEVAPKATPTETTARSRELVGIGYH
jgi:hypothetical protein